MKHETCFSFKREHFSFHFSPHFIILFFSPQTVARKRLEKAACENMRRHVIKAEGKKERKKTPESFEDVVRQTLFAFISASFNFIKRKVFLIQRDFSFLHLSYTSLFDSNTMNIE